jgi:hypothetical protein
MPPIDYTIPGQIKGVQVDSPINAMMEFAQLQGLQQQQQMNALKAQEYQRARQEENELRTLFASGVKPDSDEFRNQLYARAPGLAPGIEKNILERGKVASEVRYKDAQAKKEAADTLSKKLTFHRQVYNPLAVTTPDEAGAHAAAFYDDPDFAPYATKMMTREQAIEKSKQLFTTNKRAWLESQIELNGDKILEATERRDKQKREDDALAYSDYVRNTVLQNPDAKILSKADFLTQREANFLTQRDQAAVPTTAPATAPAPAAAVAPEGQVTTAPDGTKIMPAVQLEDPNLIEPAVAALLATGDPRDKELAQMIEKRIAESRKRNELTGDFQNVMVAEQRIAELEKNPTPLNLRKIASLRQQIKAANEGRAPKNYNIVKLPPQEQEFEKELGSGQAKAILKSKEQAEDAREMLDTVNIGRGILKSGVITGAGADFFVGLNQALKTAGVDFGYADASANSQAYIANMAQNVGKLIKLFGSGTGLSDADRKYAIEMAGGRIALDRKALEKILDIQERASKTVIGRHNKKVTGIKSKTDLSVGLDDEAASPRNAPAPYSDPDEERRYQEYKAKQKGK